MDGQLEETAGVKESCCFLEFEATKTPVHVNTDAGGEVFTGLTGLERPYHHFASNGKWHVISIGKQG